MRLTLALSNDFFTLDSDEQVTSATGIDNNK